MTPTRAADAGRQVSQDILVFYLEEGGDRIAAVMPEGPDGDRLLRRVEQKRLPITVEGVRLFPESDAPWIPVQAGDPLFFVFPGDGPRPDLRIDSRAECRCAAVHRTRGLAESALEEVWVHAFPETPLHVRGLFVGWVSEELTDLLA